MISFYILVFFLSYFYLLVVTFRNVSMAIKRKAPMSYAMAYSNPKKARKVLFKRRRKQVIKGPIKASRELNYVDTIKQGVSLQTGGATQGVLLGLYLNAIAEGDDNTQRNGRKVKIVSDRLQFSCQPGTLAVDGLTVRLVTVWDNQKSASGNVPLFTDVYDMSTQTDPTVALPLVNAQSRFTILNDAKGWINGNNLPLGPIPPRIARYVVFLIDTICHVYS